MNENTNQLMNEKTVSKAEKAKQIPNLDHLHMIWQCFSLHEFLEEEVLDYLNDKLFNESLKTKLDEGQFDQSLYDLLIMRRAFELMKKFYRERGFVFEMEKK